MSCQIENLTVDAMVHGDVMEVPTFDGGTEYIASGFREPHVDAVFCSEHGYLIENMTNGAHLDINAVVKEHLEETKNDN